MKKYVLLLVILTQLLAAEKKVEINYPRVDVSPEEVFNQELLEKSISYIFSWQQSAGSFGQLTLHSCWAVDGVIGRKYHGQYTSANKHYLHFMLSMYDETKDYTWKRRAEAIVSNIMFLQAPSGGFFHGSAENEPSYYEGKTCAIHQNMVILGLLEYAAKPYADPDLKKEIKSVIDKHWAWFNKHFYERGTRGVTDKEGWPWPCWSGVTNQDLVVVQALAEYGRVFGDMSRYEEFGKPAMEVLISDRYYYKGLGLIQRGDQPEWMFPERTPYYHLVFDTMVVIHEITGDERIIPVLEDVAEQIFRATFKGPDGLTYFAHGVNVEKDGDSLKILSYNKYPTSPTYCLGMLPYLDWYLERNPDPARQKIRDELLRTAASYVFVDGTMPRALNPGKEVFAVAPALTAVPKYLFNKLKGNIKNFSIGATPTVQRRINDLVWYEKGRMYWVEKAGERTFAGFKLEDRAIVHGIEETLACVKFEDAKSYKKNETVYYENINVRYDDGRTFVVSDN